MARTLCLAKVAARGASSRPRCRPPAAASVRPAGRRRRRCIHAGLPVPVRRTPSLQPPAPSRCIRAAREQRVAAVYPRGTAGPGATYSFNAADGGFVLRAHGKTGDPTTVVYVPPEVTGEVSSDGGVQIVVSKESDGS